MVPEEPLIQDPIPHTSDTDPEEITWQVIKRATQRGGAHLVNSGGFTYVKQKVTKTSTVWICSKRNKTLKCAACVHQRGNQFCPTETQHIHPSAPDALTSAKVRATLKESLSSHQFTAASALVTDAVHKHVTVGDPCPSLPTVSNDSGSQQKTTCHRPKHPTDLNFDLKKGRHSRGFFTSGHYSWSTVPLVIFITTPTEIFSGGKDLVYGRHILSGKGTFYTAVLHTCLHTLQIFCQAIPIGFHHNVWKKGSRLQGSIESHLRHYSRAFCVNSCFRL